MIRTACRITTNTFSGNAGNAVGARTIGVAVGIRHATEVALANAVCITRRSTGAVGRAVTAGGANELHCDFAIADSVGATSGNAGAARFAFGIGGAPEGTFADAICRAGFYSGTIRGAIGNISAGENFCCLTLADAFGTTGFHTVTSGGAVADI